MYSFSKFLSPFLLKPTPSVESFSNAMRIRVRARSGPRSSRLSNKGRETLLPVMAVKNGARICFNFISSTSSNQFNGLSNGHEIAQCLDNHGCQIFPRKKTMIRKLLGSFYSASTFFINQSAWSQNGVIELR